MTKKAAAKQSPSKSSKAIRQESAIRHALRTGKVTPKNLNPDNLTAEANLPQSESVPQSAAVTVEANLPDSETLPTSDPEKNSTSNAENTWQENPSVVSSSQVSDSPNVQDAPDVPAVPEIPKGAKTMPEITFKRSDKERKSISVVYTADGYPGSVRFSKSLFKDKNAPDAVTISNDAFGEPRKAMTPEERKAARKNAPKLTDAEKLQKIEARAARLRAKLEAKPAA